MAGVAVANAWEQALVAAWALTRACALLSHAPVLVSLASPLLQLE